MSEHATPHDATSFLASGPVELSQQSLIRFMARAMGALTRRTFIVTRFVLSRGVGPVRYCFLLASSLLSLLGAPPMVDRPRHPGPYPRMSADGGEAKLLIICVLPPTHFKNGFCILCSVILISLFIFTFFIFNNQFFIIYC